MMECGGLSGADFLGQISDHVMETRRGVVGLVYRSIKKMLAGRFELVFIFEGGEQAIR